MKKIDCLLLVDDDEAINFLHEDLIEEAQIAKEVICVQNGKEALDFLKSEGKYAHRSYPRPNVIFLDINMPLMDGFEFLENYVKLDLELRADILLLFVTTSNSEEDKKRARTNESVFRYIEKPLTIEILKDIQQIYASKKITAER